MDASMSECPKIYTITYRLKFYSEWHCGSGLGAGADVDALVIKDAHQLPFVPGKTIKGLLREAVETVLCIEGWTDSNKKDFIDVFGNSADKDWNIFTDSNSEKEKISPFMDRDVWLSYIKKSKSFFTNAELENSLKALILSDMDSEIETEHYFHFLYNSVASISINEYGIAESQHLRKMETVIPCELVGQILGVPESFIPALKKGMQFIKRLGQNRNRGLGRCDMIFGSQTLQEGGML